MARQLTRIGLLGYGNTQDLLNIDGFIQGFFPFPERLVITSAIVLSFYDPYSFLIEENSTLGELLPVRKSLLWDHPYPCS
jgi:hypothetical protein